jgi:DNA-binding IclR family transcriptional regulator
VELEVIPAGRVMFVPAFVVKSAREEQAKVCDDTRLNASTRRHVLQQLKRLECAFDDGAGRRYQMWEQQLGERILGQA